MYPRITDTYPADGIDTYDHDKATVTTAVTFDQHGEPIDYFKQVFAAFTVASRLEAEDVDTTVRLLIADDAVKLNDQTGGKGVGPSTRSHADRRQNVLEALATLYGGPLEIDVSRTTELHDVTFDRIVSRLGARVEANPMLRKLLLRAVPDHRRDPDASARENTRYVRHELAVILRSGTTVKVGPRRERFYDVPARDSSVRSTVDDPPAPVVGVYVTDTLPTDVSGGRLDQLRADGGILPYKAKTHGCDPDRHRVMLDDSRAMIKEKVAAAPPELSDDISAAVSFMCDRRSVGGQGVTSRLANQLRMIRQVAGIESETSLD